MLHTRYLYARYFYALHADGPTDIFHIPVDGALLFYGPSRDSCFRLETLCVASMTGYAAEGEGAVVRPHVHLA